MKIAIIKNSNQWYSNSTKYKMFDIVLVKFNQVRKCNYNFYISQGYLKVKNELKYNITDYNLISDTDVFDIILNHEVSSF